MYRRNQFTIYNESFLQIVEVPEAKIALHEAANAFSNLGGQGFGNCT